MDSYDKKVARAIRLLQSIPKNGPVEVSYSGGKDSDVILELAKMAGIDYRAIYKNTTIDPPGTIKHCREKGVEILHPEKPFYEIVKENGAPSMWYRVCCSHLKEYKVLERAIQGIRRSESVKRKKRYHEPEECRKYKSGKAKIYYPILDWTDEDVVRFIEERGIKCHPLYYDEKGKFRVERRLGCIGCPLSNQRERRERFKMYPKVLRRWINSLQEYYDLHPQVKSSILYDGNACNKMFYDLFCKNMQDYITKLEPCFDGSLDTKKFLEEYFEVEL